MSRRAQILNWYLRWTERPFLTRVSNLRVLRVGFEIKMGLFVPRPFGVRWTWGDLAGRRALTLRPGGSTRRQTLLYFHGGAHVFGSPRTVGAMVALLVRKAGFEAVVPQYPLAPEAPFPAGVNYALAAYQAILEGGVEPSDVIIGGDSAGGNLALSLLGQLVALDAPLPAGVFALSPITDFTFSGDSITDNDASEVILPPSRISEMAGMYLRDHPVNDPRASPLNAAFGGAPPVWLAVGDTEILRDDSLRMAERLQVQGVKVTLTVAQDLPHVWPIFHPYLPEARATLDALAGWMQDHTAAKEPTR